MAGEKVRILKRCDGSNGPVEAGTIGVVLAGPALAAEIAAAETPEARAQANYRAAAESWRGHPCRVVQVATQSGWCAVDCADVEAVEAAAEPGADAAAETPSGG